MGSNPYKTGLYIAAAGVAATTLFLAGKKYAQLEAVKKKEEEGKLEKERREKQINWMFGEGELTKRRRLLVCFKRRLLGVLLKKVRTKVVVAVATKQSKEKYGNE